MPTPLQTIFSQVQSDIGDLGFQKFQRREYLDIADDVLTRVSQECRVWTGSYTDAPIPSLDWTYDTTADRDAASYLSGDEGKVAYVVEDEQYYQLLDTTPTWTLLDKYTLILPAALAVKSLLQVRRGGWRVQEHSQQSVLNVQHAEFPWDTNDHRFGGSEFNSRKEADETVRVMFASSFAPEEEASVEYIAHHGYSLVKWTTNNQIPDYLEVVMRSGLTLACVRKLYLRGDESLAQKVLMLEKLYSSDLLAAKAHTRNFLDESSTRFIQPLKWLPE